MGLDFTTHKFRKNPVTGVMEIESINPYVRLCKGANNYIYLQAGKCYAGGGEEIQFEDVPGWVWDQMKTMNPVVLKQIGWHDQLDDALKEVGEEPKKQRVKSKTKGRWICPVCEVEMDKGMRLAHTMKHRRDEKAEEQAKQEE